MPHRDSCLTGHVAFAPVQTASKPSAVFSAKLRKLGLREETNGYGPSKEKWEEFVKLERGIHPASQ